MPADYDGDSAQLPPVGMDASPALSRSFMDGFGGVRYCELVSVVRQEKESGILRNATMLRELISSGAADSGLDSLSLDLSGVEDIARVSGVNLWKPCRMHIPDTVRTALWCCAGPTNARYATIWESARWSSSRRKGWFGTIN